ncbi:chorismate mutase [Malassezia vespertilionis]|uniref:chorismate mutase n=1 Tax=Malassezia vespertilionis TaxID=2020962 RepID=UPI0024B12FD3|nr:chorismate mutase [Malassezia vespertilionis]WFD08293.1 chorismate mutase [Malassezia vespertilionis]
MTDSINFHNAQVEDILSLDKIRATLQRMEDTIVFNLIERAQFAYNARMYENGAFPDLQQKERWSGSWLAWLPDEYAFTPLQDMPEPILKPVDYPNLLHPHHVNVSSKVLEFYTHKIVPQITEGLNRYGSSAICDVEALSAINRRVHFGMFVSESKFRSDPAAFIGPIQQHDRDALAALITKPAVEAILLERVRQKAEIYGQNLDQKMDDPNREKFRKIQAQEVVHLYKEFIIPLTKEVEVDYLLERLDGLAPDEIAALAQRKPN